MEQSSRRSIRFILFTHFMPCFFLGLITISLFEIDGQDASTAFSSLRSPAFYRDCLLNGLIDAAVVTIFHLFQNRRFHSGRVSALRLELTSARHRPAAEIITAAVIAFLAGSISIMLILYPPGLIVITLLIILLTYAHLKLFFHRVGQILSPNSTATWNDVGTFFFNYGTILCAFTLINISLEIIHHILGRKLPFNFAANSGMFIDSLYFTTVVITTLGFGDYTPMTSDSKLLVTAECLTGYVMFALMVGCITKGVVRSDRKRPDRR